MMMTPMDFYSAITPDCQLAHGVGAGAHVDVTAEQLATHDFYMEKSPKKGGILNEIGAHGLLSYTDFCFLLTMLSTEAVLFLILCQSITRLVQRMGSLVSWLVLIRLQFFLRKSEYG